MKGLEEDKLTSIDITNTSNPSHEISNHVFTSSTVSIDLPCPKL
jgi:hypothetical protein